jgi:LuxR family quorum sensing-dependent transcriptional regulator
MSSIQTASDAFAIDGDISEIVNLSTQFDVIRYMKRIAEHYGCRTFVVLNLPSATSRELSANTIVTNWPAELMSLFDSEGLMQTSLVFSRLRRSTTPFSFDVEAIPAEQVMPRVRDLFIRFGIVRGAYFPVHDISGMRGAVSWAGTSANFTHQQMMELMYIAIHVYQRLAEIRSLEVRPTDTLSEREIDCLNWTSAGKTSAEIAEILSLSEHTVNHYLNRAARKLDSVNRTQAVAKALRTGIIK